LTEHPAAHALRLIAPLGFLSSPCLFPHALPFSSVATITCSSFYMGVMRVGWNIHCHYHSINQTWPWNKIYSSAVLAAKGRNTASSILVQHYIEHLPIWSINGQTYRAASNISPCTVVQLSYLTQLSVGKVLQQHSMNL